MRVLFGYGKSGTGRRAFSARGHEVWSCDLEPSEDTSPFHIQDDIYKSLGYGIWDLIILHHPCTALSVSGNGTYAEGKSKHPERLAAVENVNRIWNAVTAICPRVGFENPQGVLSSLWYPPTQYIQPWQFGDPESKKTGLWLRHLPRLVCTKILPFPVCGYWGNQTPSGQNKLGPSPDRAAIRAKTYPGIAKAMADQWG